MADGVMTKSQANRLCVMSAIDEAFARHLVEVFSDGARHMKNADPGADQSIVGGLDRALRIRERMVVYADKRLSSD